MISSLNTLTIVHSIEILTRRNEEDGQAEVMEAGERDAKLLSYDISKKANLGPILRSACGFGLSEVLIVGQKKNMKTFGNQGTTKKIKISKFETFEKAVECVRGMAQKYQIVGVEIREDAVPLQDMEFGERTVFILGNEGKKENSLLCIDRVSHFVFQDKG